MSACACWCVDRIDKLEARIVALERDTHSPRALDEELAGMKKELSTTIANLTLGCLDQKTVARKVTAKRKGRGK